MLWKRLAGVVLVTHSAVAQNVNVGRLLRFACSQLVIERTDPLVNPGMNPSSHVHQIVGGNSFNVTMDPERMDPSVESTCTTCTYSEDFSNYWTASLYFQSPENGSFKLVPQRTNFVGLDNERHPQGGGITVYYMTPFSGGKAQTTSFKPGFRMLAGNPSHRAQPSSPQALSICHRCNGNGAGFAPCDSRDTSAFPTKICPGGIRASVIFPSCWDGKNLDSPDHSSHVAYSPSSTRNRGALAGADCPATHPVRVPQVMYEMQWDTSQFNKEEYFEGGKQPFVYSFGDRSGHGQHGDYLFGWKEGALQRGMDALLGEDCLNDRCHALKSQSVQEAVACTKRTQVEGEVVGREGQCEFAFA
ncbi:hypothetical protein B0T14DRAFT_595187 [Immersiella caudata]|uniref:DUF1996 domain-containing protein n=1 Tax=Immersiella caudata TaxID=314043 RepID=A0AA39W4J9_9PEZI|nr:hypothetical protein B0T14DRAFT_595187 [Immersiella caudata]